MILEKQTIGFIGPGVMAEAMIRGLVQHKIAEATQISISGPHQERLDELKEKIGVAGLLENSLLAQKSDIIVLSVKPQRLDKVLEGLAGSIKESTLVISIVAGAPIRKISKVLNHKAVVRAMPNTPAQIGEGITVWTCSSETSQKQKDEAKAILGAFGIEIFMDEESFLDKATALSGTGPAYVYLFMEAMVDAGVHLGFPRRIAEQLVTRTLRGSVDFYEHGDDSTMHLARLRNQVTSPGGTSAEALYYLEKAGFRTAISRAIWAAYQRSKELGEDVESHPPA